MNGIDGTHFNPKAILTRAEYVTIIVKVLDLGVEAGSKSPFTDVPSWAGPYIAAAVQAGIVNGVGGGKFDPNAPITREMATVILVRALSLAEATLDKKDGPLTFTDAKDISEWAKGYIAIAVKHGLIKGNPDGSFLPKRKASREMAAVMGSNLLTAIAKSIPKPTIPGVTELEVAQPETPATTPTTSTTPSMTPSTSSSSGGGGIYIPPTTPEVTLSSIAITVPAKKLSYVFDEDLDLTGMVVEGTYSDGSKGTLDVDAANLSGYDNTKEGSQILTVNVSGKTTTFTVTLAKRDEGTSTLSSIEVTHAPTKVNYAIGEELDLTGLEVIGHYSDDTTKPLEITAENVKGFDSSVAIETQTLTIIVGEFTTTLDISIWEKEEPPVEEANLQGIIITALPSKMNYVVGEKLDLTGLEITGHYSDGTNKIVKVGPENITGFDNTTEGNQTITVSLDGKSTTFSISLNDNGTPPVEETTLTGIEITSPPAKQIYNIGEELDLTGLKVKGRYNDDTTKVLEVTADNISGFDSSAAEEDQVVTVSVNGQSARFNVTIVPKEPPVSAPLEITDVHIESDNANHMVAKVGDTVTLQFKTQEEVSKLTNFKINGSNPEKFTSILVDNGFYINVATYVVEQSDPLGGISFQINVKDVMGFYSQTIESTSDESSVTVVTAD